MTNKYSMSVNPNLAKQC